MCKCSLLSECFKRFSKQAVAFGLVHLLALFKLREENGLVMCVVMRIYPSTRSPPMSSSYVDFSNFFTFALVLGAVIYVQGSSF